MPCFHPLQAYQNREFREISFNPKYHGYWDHLKLPCGQCIGCRLERSRQWAMRCVHEAQLYKNNCFITLTFDDDHLPENGSVDVRDFQLFMKKLRKKYGEGIRFFHCGEYGEQFGRPHYHACLFNHDFSDRVLWKVNNGVRLYRSASLEKLWTYGYSSVGDVTFESAAYVARYIMKKITGDAADEHYQYLNPVTGELHRRAPEYTTMSRRPGLGRGWLDKYVSDVYPHDRVVIRGKEMKPPKFYDNQYELLNPFEMEHIKFLREQNALKHVDNSTPERLAVREQVTLAKLARLKRTLT